jgi:hypothetical protein
MLLRWLYHWPLLFEVWQSSVSCCWGGYITDHYSLRFDRGVFHVVEVVILLIITVGGLTVECFMLLRWLYHWPLLFEVWQRSVSCCWGGYITDNYYMSFNRGVVHVVEVVILLTIAIWGLTEDCFVLLRWLHCWNYCLKFDSRVFHAVKVLILLTITIWALTGERFMLLRWLYYWPLLFEVWQGSGSCCWGDYITDHYYLRFERRKAHNIQVVIWLTITIWQWHTSNPYFIWYLLGVSYQNIAKLS